MIVIAAYLTFCVVTFIISMYFPSKFKQLFVSISLGGVFLCMMGAWKLELSAPHILLLLFLSGITLWFALVFRIESAKIILARILRQPED